MNNIFLIPFFGLLITIAVFPLINPHLWEKNKTKAVVSAIFGVPVLIYLILKSPAKVLHVGEEFISFISLVTSLFIVSGGIFIYIRKKPTPLLNTAILFFGSILANLVGTTGASMILVRPFLRLNRWRKNTFHIPIFFIFTVSNVGGGLTPIGDPPLFMGFLKGVPFFWSLKLFPIWLFEISIILIVFFIWDSITLRKEKYPETLEREGDKILIFGKRNFVYLGLILLAVIFLHFPFREIVQWTAAILSLKTTPKRIREDNEFTFHPAEEVAIVFAGIFATMTPVLDYLKDNADKFGINEPWQFFFLTGFLSSFLDNAPTYLTFFSLAQGISEKFGLTPQIAGVWEPFLKAISCGAVFFGANTYIGNAPNFMVKSISEEMRVKAPNFIAYLLYSFIILIPSFTAAAYIFFDFLR